MKAFKIILIICLLIGSFYLGYRCNNNYETISTTYYEYDTTTHIIYDHMPWYHLVLDTVEYIDSIPVNIDTAQIVKNWFAKYHYNRSWKDSLVNIELTDVISQNTPVNSTLKYNILRPQTIVNNVTNVNYDNKNKIYLDLGLFDMRNLNIGLDYQSKNFLYRVTYEPKNRIVSAGIGIKIYQFKGK